MQVIGNDLWLFHVIIHKCLESPFANTTMLIPAWINKHIHYKLWEEMTYLFPNFNSCTVEVWESISNFILHFVGHVLVITNPLKLSHISKGVPSVKLSQNICFQIANYRNPLWTTCVIFFQKESRSVARRSKLVRDYSTVWCSQWPKNSKRWRITFTNKKETR